MKKIFVLSAIIASLSFGASDAFAVDNNAKGFMAPSIKAPAMHDMSSQRRAEMERRRAEIDRRLGVTEAQKVQLKEIHEKAKLEIVPKVRQLTDIEHEISVIEKQQMNKERFNINTLENVQLSGKSLDKLKSEEKELKEEIHKIKKEQFEESQKIFTEEQRKELEKMRQEREQQMKKGMRDGDGSLRRHPF